MKVQEVVVVPHTEGVLVVFHLGDNRTHQFLLRKEQALFLTRELMGTLYKMGYKASSDPLPHLSSD